MSTTPVPVRRHALGLPAGSVRAVHVLGVVGLICAHILYPTDKLVAIPPYLLWLLFLLLGHYFAAHGVSIATRSDPAPSPLFLPGGTVRVLVIVALAACVGWRLYQDPDGLGTQFGKSLDELKIQPWLPVVIMGCFLLGAIVRSVIGRVSPSPGLQNFEAWISLIALLAIVVAAVIHLVINPSLSKEEYYLRTWESSVGGVIAFYFGERS